LRLRALLGAAGLLCAILLAAASLGEARTTKPAHPSKQARVCHRRHGRNVCTTVHTKPHRPHTVTTVTSTTSTSSSATTAAPSVSASQATTTQTTTTQTATTQTSTTTSTSSSTAAALPHGTEIDEKATGQQSPFYAMNANERTLAAGTIRFNVYNFDQDPHTFAIADANGQQVGGAVNVPAGQPDTPVAVTVDLPPGTYVLFCTLPQHAADGMKTTIVVK